MIVAVAMVPDKHQVVDNLHADSASLWSHDLKYRQFSNIKRTQSPNINVSRLVLQLSLPNPLKPGV